MARNNTKTQDGGCAGWLVVLGSHVCCMFIFGVYPSFGPLFVAIQGYFNATSASTSWILSLSLFLELGLGPLSNVCVKRFGYRTTIMTGTLISSIGYFCSSFAPSVNALYITYGVLIGLGYSLILSPCLGIIPLHIKKRYTLANSLAVLGSGIGPFLLTPIIQLLIDTYGWRGTFIVMSAINAHMFISASLFAPPDTTSQMKLDHVPCPTDDQDSTRRHRNDWCATFGRIVHALDVKLICRHPPFALEIVCAFVGIGLGSVAVPSFIVLYANDLQLSTPSIVSLLISIFAIGGIIGRLAPALLLLIKCINSGRLFGVSLLLAGISTILSPHLTMYYVTYAVYSALYGFFVGIVFSLFSHVTKDYVGGPNLTAAVALASAFSGLGAMIGPTVAGWLYDVTENYTASFYFCGGCSTFAGILMLTVEPITLRIQQTK